MFKNVPISHSISYKDTKLTLETGLLAKQATSSVLARMGETTVLATVVIGKPTDLDYLPLQVIYEERYYAGGKIKSSRFSKREGRPSDRSVLVGRMIDRSLRSLFNDNIRNDIQVIVTTLSIDNIHPIDTLAVMAASSAVSLCGIKDFQGPVSSVRVSINPSLDKIELIKNTVEKIKNTKTFDQVNKELTDVCSTIDLSNEEDKSLFYEIFQACNNKGELWVEDLKNLFKNTPKKLFVGKGLTTTVQPEYAEIENSELDLVVSGNGKNIVMLEASANIIPEKVLGVCLDVANNELVKLTDFQTQFIQKAYTAGIGKTTEIKVKEISQNAILYWETYRNEMENVLYINQLPNEKKDTIKAFKNFHTSTIDKILAISEHLQISELKDLKTACIDLAKQTKDKGPLVQSIERVLGSINSFDELHKFKKSLEDAYEIVAKKIFKENILKSEKRFDGRKLDVTRLIDVQVGVLPHNHGSSLFSRGETQVLNVLTLGTLRDALTDDGIEHAGEKESNYIHHYNFPSYSVGETGRYTGPGRREIGHGALAEKAILPILPTTEEFPYTIRVVSECMGSNGSTSMASTCASSLSLMQAGVPILEHVAGVAMGLVIDQDNPGKFKLITDIQGIEDHYGDMDFKVTGTESGVTAIQLDNKVSGLTVDILKQALDNSKNARLHILSKMNDVISKPNPSLSNTAPRVTLLPIKPEKIAELIGPGGKIIKNIIEKTGVQIDIVEEKQQVVIYSTDETKNALAVNMVSAIIKDFEIGEVVAVEVVKIEPFGAFVQIIGTEKEGLIHISKLAKERVEKVEDVLKLGDNVQAEIIEINQRGQINLKLIGVSDKPKAETEEDREIFA